MTYNELDRAARGRVACGDYAALTCRGLGHAAVTMEKRTVPNTTSLSLIGVVIAEVVGSAIALVYFIITSVLN